MSATARTVALAILLVSAAAHGDPIPGSVCGEARLLDEMSKPKTWRPGQVTVFSFFAYWCDTWRVQTPRLVNAAKTLDGLPIEVITVSVDGRWRDVSGRDKRLPALLDSDGAWSRPLGIDRVPTTVIVDAKGVIRWARSGIVRTDEVVREARRALLPRADGVVYLALTGLDAATGPDVLDQLRASGVCVTIVGCDRQIAARATQEGHRLVQSLPKLKGRLDPIDASRPGESEIVRRCLLAAYPGAMLVLHGDVRQTRAALARILGGLAKRGLSVVPIPDK